MAAMLLMVFLVILSHADAEKIPSYFKFGETLTLQPAFSEKITSIVYKFGGNLVAEWVGNEVPLTYYSTFDGRTTLNTTTGELKIDNMGKDDTGEFVVEINNVVQSQTFEPVEIKDVPDPSVKVRPLICDSSSYNCTVQLLCDGDIKESGPVTFSWRKDEGAWKESEQVMNITNDEETKKVETFSCRMKNPVSEKDSEPEQNPFNKSSGGTSGGTSGGAGWVFFLLALSFGNIF
ncbi:uncharacterized protein LOC125018614 [Mugil cephalus]|uniref:uncharacterized protein LOC125018614 n=1 Tax=Mugil cephalus TaxID=48193 RepID=UPI001FB8446B|nr:uncharacterized protein LOC125018614 [Mugil cephalus]